VKGTWKVKNSFALEKKSLELFYQNKTNVSIYLSVFKTFFA